ncbi:hypothetical protein CI109_105801 [Kwoniella shandongensis]|uniref:Uncharacterized protein n=1 Tax=Kwoniella shandongensis TaxID=1734106 RepID=A0A5M6C0D0_9TREE|nr:uncharacterized protein CI109_003140 [Kwoniella shandongensis]KAA5528608.1 hypothetical protein CI109_003140 [Kwoniella shandongensis]
MSTLPSISPYWALLTLPLLLPLLKSTPPPSRETILPPEKERVLLLGASSGVGRDLALAYAKRGAKVCLVARRAEVLEDVKGECVEKGGKEGDILTLAGDITSSEDLIKVRDGIVKAWGGIDTVHILAGLPSTALLLQLAGVSLNRTENAPPSGAKLAFANDDQPLSETKKGGSVGPTKEGLDRVAAESRALAEVNYLGTVLALACFLPLLASTSVSPALHHLSSVAATVPAPHRVIYAATKAAGLQAVESCRVECEGCGVRFFSFCPGTIDNDFRLKTAFSQTGGRDETKLPIKHSWEGLLLSPERVTSTILHHLSLSPAPQPLIPYPPFSWIPALSQPPKHLVHLPWMYRFAFMVRDTPLGWGYIEPAARKKYGLIGRA